MSALSVILVTHNSAPWIRGFVETWQKSWTGAPELAATKGEGSGGGVEIVVADSGSTDETLAIVRELLPEARIVASGNIGFGAAVNRAFEASRGDWLLICNPDLTFPADFVPFLAAHIKNFTGMSACLMAPRLLNPDGSTQASVGKFPTVFSMVRDQFRPRELRKYHFPQPTQACEIEWASGACLCVYRNLFHVVKGFDEKYFLYVEEVDFQRRLYLASNRVWFFPQWTVTHHHPNAARKPRLEVQRWAARGMLRYFAKFAPVSLFFYRFLAVVTRRLPVREALASRKRILERSTGDSRSQV